MNLKELVRTQSNLVANRRDESEGQCKQAYFLIAEAEAQGFTDKTPLKQAMRLFIQAARQRRSYVEPYIGLAYLSLLIDQKEVAQKYLLTALKLEPGNTDALQLQKYLNEGPEESDAESFALPEFAAVSGLDPDKTYDQLEQNLFQMIRSLMKLPSPSPTVKADEFEQLRKQTEELASSTQSFDRQISGLEKEFDTSELRRRLRPLEVILQRSQRALEVSEQMQLLQKQIAGLIETVRGISSRLQQPAAELLKRLEAELESVMDSCDWVADQLDQIDGQGHDISVLEHGYNILSAMIEGVRDTLDEQHG